MEALKKIQAELKAPKNQRNKFGNYNYRSAEDILEAVKPLLAAHGAELTISDDIIEVGGRIYVKATCRFSDGESKTEVTAYAREPESKKGMDEPQITGTASSYARKYALNGLFLIDDTKDADSNEYQQQTRPNPPPAEKVPMITAEQINEITELVQKTGADSSAIMAYYKVQNVGQMTAKAAAHCIATLRERLT